MQNANTMPALPAGLDARSDYERALEQYINERRVKLLRQLYVDGTGLLAQPVRKVQP